MSKNKVELIGHYGSDKLIACSAWTSTSRNLTEDKIKRIPKLIDMLWSEGHETPFEKGVVHFLVDTEIASHIHLLKHRISSMNGESARYKELKEDKMYLPEDWGIKVNDDTFDHMDQMYGFITEHTWKDTLKWYTEIGNELYHRSLEELTPVLGRKRAKESARFFKTYNSQIEGDISFNMRSFANFIKLRDSEHAQLEIREVAQEMWKLVKDIPGNPFEHTLNTIENRIKTKQW
jgi:thymidylate synthase (FAD)